MIIDTTEERGRSFNDVSPSSHFMDLYSLAGCGFITFDKIRPVFDNLLHSDKITVMYSLCVKPEGKEQVNLFKFMTFDEAKEIALKHKPVSIKCVAALAFVGKNYERDQDFSLMRAMDEWMCDRSSN